MQRPIFPLSYYDAAKLFANGLKPVVPASLLAVGWFTLIEFVASVLAKAISGN